VYSNFRKRKPPHLMKEAFSSGSRQQVLIAPTFFSVKETIRRQPVLRRIFRVSRSQE
jgi:hypothetical protein